MGHIVFPEWSSIVHEIESKFQFEPIALDSLMYHYTSLSGFQSILQNRDFWISNIRYMNDAQEFEDGKAICKKAIGEKILTSNGVCKDFLEQLHDACDQESSLGFFKISSKDIFSLCFCESGDILTQWNFYGSEGVSIGFLYDPRSFNRIELVDEGWYDECNGKFNSSHRANSLFLVPHRVIYDDSLKTAIFNEIIDFGLDFIKRFGPSDIEMCIEGISDALFYFFALMKSPHFSHEKELRFIDFTNENRNRICFRKRNGILLPYLKMKMLDPNHQLHEILPVRDIIISPGPQKEYIAQNIKYFLECNNYEYLVDKVRTSNIPYRT